MEYSQYFWYYTNKRDPQTKQVVIKTCFKQNRCSGFSRRNRAIKCWLNIYRALALNYSGEMNLIIEMTDIAALTLAVLGAFQSQCNVAYRAPIAKTKLLVLFYTMHLSLI